MKINQLNLSSAKVGLENSREGVQIVGVWERKRRVESSSRFREKSEKNKKAMMVNLPWPLAELILESWVGKMAQRLKICWELEF